MTILLTAALLALSGLNPAAACSTPMPLVLLDANFDDKPLNQPIGTGGALLGEPIYVSSGMSAIVRQDAVLAGNRQLELATSSSNANFTWFEFPEAQEIVSGIVTVSSEFVLGDVTDFGGVRLSMKEQGGAAYSFTTISLWNDGTLRISDRDGQALYGPGLVNLNATNTLIVEHDLDTGTYSVWFNDVLRLEDREHGVTSRGIGRIMVGFPNGQSIPQIVRMDSLLVTAPSTDTLYYDGFEAMSARCPN